MSIIAGRDVPKDRRTNAEISTNSGVAGSAPGELDGRTSKTASIAARLRFDRYILDLQRGCLLDGGEEIALRPKTFEFLRYLAANSGRLVPKDELMTAVWQNVIVTDDSLVQCVAELRRALQDRDQRLIKTVQRRGYRFEATLTPEPIAIGPKNAEPLTGPVPGGSPTATRYERQYSGMSRRAWILTALGACTLLAAWFPAHWWGPGMRDRSATASPLSIVVLPFRNLSSDPDQEYLAESLTDDLATDLSRLPGTFVIAPATARTLKGKQIEARQVGRDLSVRYLLEGSVHRSGEQVRINVQLIDADTGTSIWAERFERDRAKLAIWQDEIVGRIATTLNLRLTRLESERALRERRDNPEAYDLTMRGWAQIYTAKKPENYDTARTLFQRALERDAHAVNAMTGIGWVSAVSVLNGWSALPVEDVSTAEAAVAQALTIEPNHVVAHHVRGFVLRLQQRTEAARDAFRTAVELNPNFASGHAQLGITELELGRPAETIKAVERAIRLSPRDPNIGHWFAMVGMAELHLGHFKEAVSWLGRAVHVDTGSPTVLQRAYFVSALALAGHAAEARVALAELRAAKPATTIASLRAEARSTVAEFVAQRERLYEGLRMPGLPD